MSKDSEQLTEKQRIFVEEYAKTFNGTEAAITAGFSKKTARSQASQLLNNINIQQALLRQVKCNQLLLDHEKDDVVKEVAAIAFSDIAEHCSWNDGQVTLTPSDQIPLHARRSIKRVTMRSTESEKGSSVTVTVDMHDKMKALEFLGRYWSLQDAGNSQPSDLGPQFRRILDAARRVATNSKK